MPATWPRIQFLGSGFGQNGSTWNFGASSARAQFGTAPASTRAAATVYANLRMLILVLPWMSLIQAMARRLFILSPRRRGRERRHGEAEGSRGPHPPHAVTAALTG